MDDIQFDEKDFENVLELLQQYADQFKATYKRKLKDDKRIATGRLYNNVSVDVKYRNLVFTVVFNAPEYYKWLENGRKPTKNSGNGEVYDKILQWVQVKGIKGRANPDTGKLPTQEQLAHAITKKIHKFGYEGGNYLKETRDELSESYIMPALKDALQKDFDERFSIKIFNDINKSLKKVF